MKANENISKIIDIISVGIIRLEIKKIKEGKKDCLAYNLDGNRFDFRLPYQYPKASTAKSIQVPESQHIKNSKCSPIQSLDSHSSRPSKSQTFNGINDWNSENG